MAELFEPDEKQKELESDDDQGDRNLLVLTFFFIVFAGALALLFHWLAPKQGRQVYATAIAVGGYYATWLFRKFQRRG